MIMVMIAQEEEGRSEDWISCLNPWLWEVRVTAQVREVVTEGCEGKWSGMQPRSLRDRWM